MKLFTNWKKKYEELELEINTKESNFDLKILEYKDTIIVLKNEIRKCKAKITKLNKDIALLSNQNDSLRFEIVKANKKTEKEASKIVKRKPGRPKKENK